MVFEQLHQKVSTTSTAAKMVTSRSRCFLRKKTWLKFHDGQYQFKVPFMLHHDFESILKQADEQYRDKINQLKAERNVKTLYTEKINKRVRSECRANSTFAYGDVSDLLKMYREKFIGHIEDAYRAH